MVRKRNHHDRGTVILMAVGILVMLAMIGTTFVIVSHLDRREAGSLALAASSRKVAAGVLAKIQSTLMDDLGFYTYAKIPDGNNAGEYQDPAGPVRHVYERCDRFRQQYTFPSEIVDPWLADDNTYVNEHGNTVYAHSSNLYSPDPAFPRTRFENVPVLDYFGAPIQNGSRWLVDADGDRKTDSVLVDTGIRDRRGNYLYVAVRIIDLSGRVNVNTVGAAPFTVPNTPNPLTDMNWAALGLVPVTTLHTRRMSSKLPPMAELSVYGSAYVPRPHNPLAGMFFTSYDTADLLAILWRESDTNSSTYLADRGRLPGVLGEVQFVANRHLLTTWSTSRNLAMQVPEITADPKYAYSQRPIAKVVGLNKVVADAAVDLLGSYNKLFDGFYNSIPRDLGLSNLPAGLWNFPAGVPITNYDNAKLDRLRRALAAQMAVNVLDFADVDNTPTFAAVDSRGNSLLDGQEPGRPLTVCGIERQPFITEAFHPLQRIDATAPEINWPGLKMPFQNAVITVSQYIPSQDGVNDDDIGDYSTDATQGELLAWINPGPQGDMAYLRLYIAQSRKFAFGFTGFKGARDDNQISGQILFGGNFVCRAPRFSRILYGITS
ncbi:hypothetical protein LCGC14_1261360 [marine sediment metagenome]|uniref:Uncharacterized protein n=1 Tax=marine sediment metagenome TaxID=412755 RepID=A0A0F9L323_9ZZZZ